MTEAEIGGHATGLGRIVPLVRLLRPRQWYKQVIVFLPVVFSGHALEADMLVRAMVGAVAFTAIAGAAYALNDVLDVEEDRQHPLKRHRPVASGAVPVVAALAFAAVLATASLGIGLVLGGAVAATIGVYALQNVLYSTFLRQVAYLDVLVVANGFVLRALAGVFAVGARVSLWLVLCTFLLALVLALAKRRDELEVGTADDARGSLRTYAGGRLDSILVLAGCALLGVYAVYPFASGRLAMVVTIPSVCLGLYRFYRVVFETDDRADPLSLLTDPTVTLAFVSYGVLSLFAIYVW